MKPHERLQMIMKANRISQRELIEISGKSQTTVHRIFMGQYPINFEILKYLRNRYNVDINDFFHER